MRRTLIGGGLALIVLAPLLFTVTLALGFMAGPDARPNQIVAWLANVAIGGLIPGIVAGLVLILVGVLVPKPGRTSN
jgi:hypothetical protein